MGIGVNPDYDYLFDPQQAPWEDFTEDLPVCRCCGHSVYPGDRYHETRRVIVCASCMNELNENECILEE